ncbi:MAG: ATP-dependent Clp protease ATP-binding subunit, partial [Chloroflexi bacterium]|nr:ATP-dependent Clp protease ATP-binding subunit [Chloroflexota bacterium]
MRSRFHRFTDEARKVLVQAQCEARRLHHELIGPEHVVLAMLSDGSPFGERIVDGLGIDRARFRSELESLLGVGNPDGAPMGLSDHMYQVLDLALEEALRGDNGSVRVEHLLVAVVRHGNNMAAGILETYGITLSRVREAIDHLLTIPAIPVSGASADARPVKPAASPALDKYGADLTALARAGKLDSLHLREHELDRVVQTLVRRRKNNPLLVGEPGVGKTAIVEKLAQV